MRRRMEQHGIVRGHDDREGDEAERPAKRPRTELLEIYMNHIESMGNRKRKEVHLNKMTPMERQKFRKAFQMEIQTNLASGAYELLSKGV